MQVSSSTTFHFIFETVCPSYFHVAVINTMTKTTLGGKGIFCLTGYSLSLMVTKAGIKAVPWRQELKQGPYKTTALAYFPMACSASLLIAPRTHLPRAGTTDSGLGSPP